MSGEAFAPFPKVPRLLRDCVVTEKLDGTNALVVVPDDGGPLRFGSRTRWITPEQDNQGFARWCLEHEASLRELGPGFHYGEWWGRGIQRAYGLAERRFSLFNAQRWTPENVPEGLHVVPLIYAGPFSTYEIRECVAELERNGSRAAPGFERPEGVAVFHEAARSYFKITIGNDGHKEAAAA